VPKPPRKCTFLVRGRQCSRVGEGNPPLCEEHEAEVYGDEEDEQSEGAEILDEFLDDIADDPRVQGALGKVSGFIDSFAHLVDRVSTPKSPGERRAAVREAWDATRAAAERANTARQERKATKPGQAPSPGPRRPQAPPPRPPPPRRPQPARDLVGPARVALGFPAGLKLTVEMVKERRKQLALIFHSDKGGSEEAMKRVNAAADILLEHANGK